MFLSGSLLLFLLGTVSSIHINGTSHFIRASELNADGNRTFVFDQPMLVYVSRIDSNQKYDTNIRFIDEKSGVKVNAWAAAQSSVAGGRKKPVFIEGRKEITIHNFNEHAFDDTTLSAVFYFVEESLGSSVYEATEAIERRKTNAGDYSTVTIMSASMSIALFDFKFPKGAAIRVTAGGANEVESDEHELITFDDHVMDASSWVNVPLPLVTLTSNDMASFQASVSTKQADRSMAPVGVRTIVMSPGYPFDIPSQDRKYSFKLDKSAQIRVEYLGKLGSSSSVEVVGSDAKGKQTYEKKYTREQWVNRTGEATFRAETISVDLRRSVGSLGGVLVRIYTTSAAPLLSLFPLFLLSALRLM